MGTLAGLTAFFLYLLLFTTVSGRFVVEKGGVSILSPEHLQSRHDSAIANFGVPDYGGTLIGAVVYSQKDSTACTPFDRPLKSRPVILLVDRGECFFALKAWNGQKAGVAPVLVADSMDEPLITMDTPQETGDSETYIDKINIPSALVNWAFGDAMKKASEKGAEIVIKLDWRDSIPHPDYRVEYEFWTNSNDECGLRCVE